MSGFTSGFTGAVYPSPGEGLPEVAIIVEEGQVVLARAVASVEDGEKLIRHTLAGLRGRTGAESVQRA